MYSDLDLSGWLNAVTGGTVDHVAATSFRFVTERVDPSRDRDHDLRRL